MKRKWTALLMAMAMVLLAVTAGLAATVLFADKFTSLDPSWAAPSANIDAKDGKLIITPDKNMTQTYINQANFLPDDIEVDYTMAFVKSDDPTYGSGLIFWASDYNSWYSILINNNGFFAVQRLVSGHYLLPVAWREDPSIKKGIGAENQVKLVTKGNQGTLFINGKQVISFTGQPPQGGTLVGFKVASGPQGQNSVAFSNFQVLQP
ncbi:MAG: hypothetical protein WCF59_04535 [Desulfobaccales bacterium]|jgi:hypothetical protein